MGLILKFVGSLSFFILLCFRFSWAASTYEFAILQTNYSGRAQINEQNNQYAAFNPNFQTLNRWGSPESSHHIIAGQGFALLPLNYDESLGVALPDFYYQYVLIPKKVKFGLGRIKENWSLLDSHWNMGIWQPLVRWDAANPIELGLTGAYFEASGDLFRMVVLTSGLFFPDQQPDYQEENGNIISANRWFRAPADQGFLFNNKKNVYYQVNEPAIDEVIYRNSFAGMFELGDKDDGPFIKASYSNKPANQFHLMIETREIFDIASADFTASIYPEVVRHQLMTLEAGYKWADAAIVLSTNSETYDKPELPESWLQTPLQDARYDGVIVSNTLHFLGLKRTQLAFSYVKKTILDKPNDLELISGDVEASTQRFQFREMSSTDLSTNILRTFRQQIDLHLKYVYSFSDAGEWLQAGIKYHYERQWTWALSGDVFGVAPDTSSSTSFISAYRGNDRVMGSMAYVF